MSSSTKQVIVTIVIIFLAVVFIVLGIRFVTGFLKGAIKTKSPSTATTTSISKDVETDKQIEKITTVKAPSEQYSGKLTLAASVDEIIGERAFAVKNTGLFESRILVISKKGIAPVGAKTIDEYLIKRGDRLLIKGEVQKFDPATIEKKTDMEMDLDNLKDWFGKPVIIASEIDRIN